MLALACMNEKEKGILYPRWSGIEAGATLSDDFRIMWEPESARSDRRQLVHRCFIDSDDPKDHGCVTRALDHAEGSIAFIRDWMKDPKGYTENEFLENLGMFLGIASHHIADLCTPIHVGHRLEAKSLGFRSVKALHSRIEADIDRQSHRARLQLRPEQRIEISGQFFWDVAEHTYKTWYIRLADVYSPVREDVLIRMASDVLSSAVRHTRDVWHSIIASTEMTSRTWSRQPLL